MSAFRDNTDPRVLEEIRRHGRSAPLDILAEMRALGGGSLEEWGAPVPSGPTGPRPLVPSPHSTSAGPTQRPLTPSPRPQDDDELGMSVSVVANDPGVGVDYARRARIQRRIHVQDQQRIDDRAILQDPRVQANLGAIYRQVQDIDHLIRQQQERMESIRLHVAHQLQTAARDPDQAAQLRGHLPNLLALLRELEEGEPARTYRGKVEVALAELDNAGFGSSPFQTPSY